MKGILFGLMSCCLLTGTQAEDSPKPVQQNLSCEQWLNLPFFVRITIPPPDVCLTDDSDPHGEPDPASP